MRKFLLLSTIFILITGCSFSKKPTFKYVDTIEVKKVSLRNITLNANVIFNNPNHLKGKLSIEDMHIFVDKIDVATIGAQEFDVPPESEFAIPLEGIFSLSKIHKENKDNLLSGILKVVQTDSLEIQFKGIIRYHLGSFSYPYTIDKQQKIRVR